MSGNGARCKQCGTDHHVMDGCAMSGLEQKCRAYCHRQKINPDMEAPRSWQATPGPRTNDRVLMWHTVICEVQRKPIPSTANKEAAARKAELQRMIDDSKSGKKYSCVDP